MLIAVDGNEANVKNRVGVNQYAAELLAALEKLPDAKKHEWIVYLKDKPLPGMPKERKGFSFKILPGRGFWVLLRLMPHLWRTSPRPDILFTPSHYTPIFLPFPIVLSVMDLGYLRFPQQFRKRDFYQLKYWGALSMLKAKRIIAISESTKEEIVSHYKWASHKVVVARLGFDKRRFQFPVSNLQINAVKKKYDISGEYLLFLSTLKPSKNVEGLLEAFRLVLANASESRRIEANVANLNLVIAGKKGWLYESVFEKVKKLGLENFVTFTDFVPEEDKPALLAGAKAFVSPSFWEGFGMHVLEAMAVGTPVVVSKTGSLPEIVGDAGTLVDPDDPKSIARGIEKVVSQPQDEYNKLRRNVILQASKFSWEQTAKETLKVLESAAE